MKKVCKVTQSPVHSKRVLFPVCACVYTYLLFLYISVSTVSELPENALNVVLSFLPGMYMSQHSLFKKFLPKAYAKKGQSLFELNLVC